jgi:hypothetical protein
MDEARTISAANWTAQKSALNQEAPVRPGTTKDDLLEQMDPEVARSFTQAQLQEIKRVLPAPASGRLPIDIRITVPFLRRRYFITVLAGPEQRSEERLKVERAKHVLWTFTNVCCFVFLLLLFIPALIGLVHILAVGNP